MLCIRLDTQLVGGNDYLTLILDTDKDINTDMNVIARSIKDWTIIWW